VCPHLPPCRGMQSGALRPTVRLATNLNISTPQPTQNTTNTGLGGDPTENSPRADGSLKRKEGQTPDTSTRPPPAATRSRCSTGACMPIRSKARGVTRVSPLERVAHSVFICSPCTNHSSRFVPSACPSNATEPEARDTCHPMGGQVRHISTTARARRDAVRRPSLFHLVVGPVVAGGRTARAVVHTPENVGAEHAPDQGAAHVHLGMAVLL
jgi:hypothetical protein